MPTITAARKRTQFARRIAATAPQIGAAERDLRFQERLKKSLEQHKALFEAARKSEQLSAKDFAIRINKKA